MQRYAMRKWKLSLITLGLSLGSLILASLNFLAFIAPILIIVGVWLFLASFAVLSITEGEDFIYEAKLSAQEKKAQRLRNNEEIEESTSKWTNAEIVSRIEATMVGSGFYAAEDWEKRPGYLLSQFYSVNSIDEYGNVQVTFHIPAGKDREKLRKLGSLLSSGLQYEGSEELEGSVANDGQLHFMIYATKPEDGKINFAKDTFLYTEEVNSRATFRNIPIGVDEFGQEVAIDPFENHILIAGSSGGGKSVVSRDIVNGLATTNAILLGIDMKNGVELALLEDRFTAVAITKLQSALLLEAAQEEMNIRYRTNKKLGRPNTPWDDPDDKPIVLIVDEAAQILDKELYTTPEEKAIYARINASMKALFALARAASITIIMMTQSPKAEIINTSMRNNFMSSIALRTKDSNQQKTILGDDSAEKPTIKTDEKGAGYIIGAGFADTTKIKFYFSDIIPTKKIIEENKGNTPVLPIHSNRWNKLEELLKTQWEDFILAEMSMGIVSAEATEALNRADKLSVALKDINNVEDYVTILSYAQANNSDFKALIARYPDFDDLEEFAIQGNKKFNL